MPLFGRKKKENKPVQQKTEKVQPVKEEKEPAVKAGAKKIVMFCCGTAIATSTVVALTVQEMLKDRGINIETRQCKAAEVAYKIHGVDLIVSTTPINSDIGDVPVIVSIAFLTGIGKDAAIEQIADYLK